MPCYIPGSRSHDGCAVYPATYSSGEGKFGHRVANERRFTSVSVRWSLGELRGVQSNVEAGHRRNQTEAMRPLQTEARSPLRTEARRNLPGERRRKAFRRPSTDRGAAPSTDLGEAPSTDRGEEKSAWRETKKSFQKAPYRPRRGEIRLETEREMMLECVQALARHFAGVSGGFAGRRVNALKAELSYSYLTDIVYSHRHSHVL